MNRLYVLEGGMSLTGAKADVRLPMRPSALARIAFGWSGRFTSRAAVRCPQDWSCLRSRLRARSAARGQAVFRAA
jgi:hypothetical protein